MSKYTRRDIIQSGLEAAISLSVYPRVFAAASADLLLKPYRLDLTLPPAPQALDLHMGTARRPDGRTLTADSRSLLLDGKPWLPVMGEFHHSRYPESEWAGELHKMRVGGLDIVATYIFWIHHEETQGQWNWTGRRDLHRFLTLCADAGMTAIVRCGPFAHGEVRNGGIPDWVQHSGTKLRSIDPAFLALVRPLYAQIADQMKGLLWKDGGPVVGIQCDNEYGGPAEYLLMLKTMARDLGLDVPLYTRTGWPALSTPLPFGEMLPLFGSYAEGFWDRGLTPMPGNYGDAFRFLLARGATTAAIGTDQLGTRRAREGDDTGPYPYFCCEIGGGMETSYHRRIRVAPKDLLSTGLVKIGSGNNLQGYYMYHGGTNPDGRLTTLQESQATGMPNDLPVKTYDFFAPLGEFGQRHPHYHLLRRMHLFLRDWGPSLATMPTAVPANAPTTSQDSDTLRWSVRSDGRTGIVFVNNFQRLQSMPAKPGVQFDLGLAGGRLRFPAAPVTIPADSAFFWPFNLDLGGATLAYATAQPVARLEDGTTTYVVFSQTAGVPTEFVFTGRDVRLDRTNGNAATAGGRIHIRDIRPGTDTAIRLHTPHGPLQIILLDEAQSLECWKGTWGGRERLFLSRAGLTLDGGVLELSADNTADFSVGILPAPAKLTGNGKITSHQEGLLRRCTVVVSHREAVKAVWELVQSAGPARPVPIGSQRVAEAPSDADFDHAAVWRLRLPPGTDPSRDLRLCIRYRGDVARIYLNGKFLDDNFYNGRDFEFGLKRYGPDIYQGELLLKVLPLRKDAPIYLSRETWASPDPWPDFGGADSLVRLLDVDVVESRTVSLHTA